GRSEHDAPPQDRGRTGLVLRRGRRARDLRRLSVLLDAAHGIQIGCRSLQPQVQSLLVQCRAHPRAYPLPVWRYAVPAMDLEPRAPWAWRGCDHADRDLAGWLQPRPHLGKGGREPRHRHFSHLPGATDPAVSAALTRRVAAWSTGFPVVAGSRLSHLH